MERIVNLKRIGCTMLAIVLIFVTCACGGAKTVEDYLDLGNKYLLDGNYEEAVIAFTSAIEIDDKNIDAYLGAAKAYHGQMDYASELKMLEQADSLADNESMQTEILIKRIEAHLYLNTDNMVDFSDTSFLGVNCGDFSNYDLVVNTLSNKLSGICYQNQFEDNGFKIVNWNLDRAGLAYYYHNDGNSFMLQAFRPNEAIKLDTGFFEIKTGDQVVDILNKLGISDADNLSKWLVELWDADSELSAGLQKDGIALSVGSYEYEEGKAFNCIDIQTEDGLSFSMRFEEGILKEFSIYG